MCSACGRRDQPNSRRVRFRLSNHRWSVRRLCNHRQLFLRSRRSVHLPGAASRPRSSRRLPPIAWRRISVVQDAVCPECRVDLLSTVPWELGIHDHRRWVRSSAIPFLIFLADARSLSDIDLSTATNDAPASALFSAKKNPQRIPANTLPCS